MTQLFEDLFDELDQIEEIVHPKRRMSETHRGILMKSRMFALKSKLNATILAEELDPETRIMGYLKTIERLKRILSHQDHRSQALFWYELHMFHQLLVANIVIINGAGGKLGIIGLAHALADLLVGLEVKNPMSLLTDPNDPDWEKRINIAYNISNGQVSLYATLMQQLAFMPRTEAISFTTKILEGLGYLEELLEKVWNPEKILKSRVSIANEEEKINSVLVLANAPYNMAIAHYNFWPRFGNRLQGFDTLVLHRQASTSDLFFEKVKSLISQTDKKVEELKKFMKKDKELKNVNLDQFPAYQFSQMQKMQVAKIVQLDSVVNDFLIKGKFPTNAGKLIEELNGMLNNLSPYLTNKQLIYGNAVGEIFASFATYYLYLSGFFSLQLGKPDYFTETQNLLSVFFTKEGEAHFPLIHVYNAIIQLAIDTKIFPEKVLSTDYEEKVGTLTRLMELLNYYPREKICLSAIRAILSYYRGTDTEDTLEAFRSIAEDYGIEGRIRENMERYRIYLKDRFDAKETDHGIKVEPSTFDRFSVIRPKFDKVSEISGKQKIDYIPFNSLQLSVFDQ